MRPRPLLGGPWPFLHDQDYLNDVAKSLSMKKQTVSQVEYIWRLLIHTLAHRHSKAYKVSIVTILGWRLRGALPLPPPGSYAYICNRIK